MYYPIIALESALKDIQETRNFVIGHAFPVHVNIEVAKIDMHVEEIENAIKILTGIKKTSVDPHINITILEKYKRGVNIQTLANEYNVSYKTIQRIIKKTKKLV
tara:strand:- start:188 stop:499 length:312 start_codon:yes stop_codon:yes gene_type:complete